MLMNCNWLFLRGILLILASFCAVVFLSAQQSTGSVSDIDGNAYTSVKIGDQEWLRENLKTTRYNDGTPIPNVTDVTEWRHIDAPAYVWYGNDKSNKEIYGALYNWNAPGSRPDICPPGWRVPTDEDWKKLEGYLGMTPDQIEGVAMRGTDQGGKLKEAGNVHWAGDNVGATNEAGLTLVPGGRIESNGLFGGLTTGATFWTATETSVSCAYYRHFGTGSAQIGRNPNGEKKFGLAVRCIKK